MRLWNIAWRSIQYRRLASILTAISMSLGVALVVTVIVIYGVVSDSFNKSAQGYDMIVGPKGSTLEVVLSTVFYLKPPVGTIPASYLKELRTGKYSHLVEQAIPVSIGHHFRGCPVIGTTPDFLDKLEYMGGRKYSFLQGKNIEPFEEHTAVIGYRAWKKAGLALGEKFQPAAPGEDSGRPDNDHASFTIVGILNPTGTPNDNAIFVNVEGFDCMHDAPVGPGGKAVDDHGHDHAGHDHAGHDAHDHDHGEKPADKPEADPPKDDHDHAGHDHAGHDHAGHDHAHDHDHAGHVHGHGHSHEPTAYSAILVMMRQHRGAAPTAGVDAGSDVIVSAEKLDRARVDLEAMKLPQTLDKTLDVQAVFPAREVAWLFESMIGNIQMLLVLLAVLVIVVAGIGMMVSIYNSMSERRQEIAVMRALGARRTTVMAIILLESIILSLCGGLLGVVLGHLLIGAIGPKISEYTGIIVQMWQFQWTELILIPGLVVLASIVGYLPAAVAYKQDVATSLAP